MSICSAIRSALASLSTNSTRTSGYAARKSATQAMGKKSKKSAVAATRTRPLGSWLPVMSACPASTSPSTASAHCS
ncbi:hypothetical protein D3C87_1032390 [compost metagenome]